MSKIYFQRWLGSLQNGYFPESTQTYQLLNQELITIAVYCNHPGKDFKLSECEILYFLFTFFFVSWLDLIRDFIVYFNNFLKHTLNKIVMKIEFVFCVEFLEVGLHISLRFQYFGQVL